jgi:MFS transporter, YNFM family, putative membrane transport protein
MTHLSAHMKPSDMATHGPSPDRVLRSLIIGLTAFLTVVDLFATQAILPSLTRHYGVTPAAMGIAVNASTFGMAVSSLVVGFFSPHIDRRLGILLSLALLAIPTSLLAVAPNLAIFTALRIAQGLCMASAFALTLAYLGEQCSAMDAGGAFAAYITGNVASNLIGRLISAAVADRFGLHWNFYFFATLNLAGAALVHFTIHRVQPMHAMTEPASPLAAMLAHWRNPRLRAAFGIGFCILFAFIGTFTFVNFVWCARPCRSA